MIARPFLNSDARACARFSRSAFTLIELLVVIGIIGILASMLMPSLSRGKEEAQKVRCLNNLHQIGLGIRMFIDDHQDEFPAAFVPLEDPQLAPDASKPVAHAIGGRDPLPTHMATHFPSARARPLFGYLPQSSEVFRCAADKGEDLGPDSTCTLKPSNWATIGCSYTYNAGSLPLVAGGRFLKTPADAARGLGGKKEGWAPDPSRYIMVHEPPARMDAFPGRDSIRWFQWHLARGPSDFMDPRVAPQRFISPVLFVDGHVAVHNFSKSLQNIYTPYEPTKDWIWYKPAQP